MILTSPTQKEEVTANCIYWSEDDGDGKNNTNDYIYKMDASWSGMKKPFGPGTRWTFRMEDLIHSYWDGTNMVDDVLAQGLWQFDIPIGEKDGDFQEIELVKKPIKAQALTGSKLDGTDIFEDREITSFTLRSLSATIVSEGSPLFGGGRDQHIYVVMKDGSKVELQGMNGMTYAAASPIDVTKVDHVLMADGTKIPAPDSSIS